MEQRSVKLSAMGPLESSCSTCDSRKTTHKRYTVQKYRKKYVSRDKTANIPSVWV